MKEKTCPTGGIQDIESAGKAEISAQEISGGEKTSKRGAGGIEQRFDGTLPKRCGAEGSPCTDTPEQFPNECKTAKQLTDDDGAQPFLIGRDGQKAEFLSDTGGQAQPKAWAYCGAKFVDSGPKANGAPAGKRRMTARFAASNAAKIAVLTAVSYVLYMFVKFPLPFLFPSFLDIQISDLPALLGGFAMGPLSGCLIILFKCLLKLPFSTTAYVGELGDVLIGIAFVLPASLVYKFYKNKKGAFLGIIAGVVTTVAAALAVNRFILIPFFLELYTGGNWDTFLGMFKPLYPSITVGNFYGYYLTLAVAPFNILRSALTGALTFLVYKPLSRVLHWEIKARE